MKIFVLFLNIVYLKNNLALVNIAPGSTGKYCDSIALTQMLFDGKTGKDLVTSLTNKCSEVAYIEFKTSKKYFVHYFMIYRGEGPDVGQMKYIRTEIYINSWTGYVECGEHYQTTVPYDVGIRINCPPKVVSNWFKVISQINEGLYISEVELNYIGNNAEEVWMIHKGCFKTIDSHLKPATDLVTCGTTCTEYHSYAAMKGNECRCGTRSFDEDSLVNCDIKCSTHPDRRCGGSSSYSVYLVNFRLPYYHGCFERTDLTSLAIEGNMSPGKCLKHCEIQQLAWISKGNKCQCSDDTGNAVLKRGSCTAPCTGDNTFICGSQSDTVFSVWRGCIHVSTRSVKCSIGIMCDGLYNGYGICTTKCKNGYSGQHCLERINYTEVVYINTDPYIITVSLLDKLTTLKGFEFKWNMRSIYMLLPFIIIILTALGIFIYRSCEAASASFSS